MNRDDERTASKGGVRFAGGFIAGCGVGLWLFMLLGRTSFLRAFGPTGAVGLGVVLAIVGLAVSRQSR